MQQVRVFSPATVANVSCGFDIFGFAIDEPGDEIIATASSKPGVRITRIVGDGGKLPLDPAKNSAAVSVMGLLKHVKSEQGIDIEVHKKMPMGSGLGSSAASAAGGVFAANLLLGSPLSSSELVPFAMEAEAAACGAAHADNVAPALLGGFVLIRSYQPLDVIKVPTQLELYCTVVHPDMEILTEHARKVLPKEIPLTQHVAQTGNVAGLVVGLMTGDASLISRSLSDVIVEPVRATLIPGFAAMKQAAREAGALGCSISGSGPSLFALSTSAAIAQTVGKAMQAACFAAGMASDVFVSKMNPHGPKVMS